jgi:hydrogenase maturation factor
MGDRCLVLALDPVTLSSEPGRFAVEINANDIAVMGAEPRWLLAGVLLPSGATEADARAVMEAVQASCARLGVQLIGGHTEITPTVTQTVVAACMVGEVATDSLVTSAGARPGDALLLAGSIAVEGTAILCREAAEELHRRGVPDETIRAGAALLDDPGISVLPAVRALTEVALPRAMHDPTEGGVLTAVRELVTASGAGVRIDADEIPILPACRAVCDALELDPLALLASGSLLAAVAPSDTEAARAALEQAGIQAALIGEVTPQARGLVLVRGRQDLPLPEVERDELARWFESTA